jgi:hypothetical protein
VEINNSHQIGTIAILWVAIKEKVHTFRPQYTTKNFKLPLKSLSICGSALNQSFITLPQQAFLTIKPFLN